jgi:hypothetical protein
MHDEFGLTMRERLFCVHYVKPANFRDMFNGTRAAISAGFSPLAASAIASRLLRKDKVRDYINRLRREVEMTSVTVETVLKKLALGLERSIPDLLPNPDEFNSPEEFKINAELIDTRAGVACASEISKILGFYNKKDDIPDNNDPTPELIELYRKDY